jgi:hypothetical protein
LLKAFFDQLNELGNIPIALSHWQMTGAEAHFRGAGE